MKKTTYLFLTVLVALLLCGCNDTTNSDEDLSLIPDESKNYVKVGNDAPLYFEEASYGLSPNLRYITVEMSINIITETHMANLLFNLIMADNTLKELKDGEYTYIKSLDNVDVFDFLTTGIIITYGETNNRLKALYVERGSFVVTTEGKEKHVKGTFTLTTGETLLINFYI